MSLNSIQIQGRLAKDPELKSTNSGKKVCTFDLAVDRDFGGSDGKRETDWITIVTWEKTAEFVCRYFHKGSQMLVNGRLQTRTYESNGQKRKAYEVIASNIYFCGSKQDNGGGTTADQSVVFDEIGDVDGALPF